MGGAGIASSKVSASPRSLEELVFVINGESNSGGQANNSEATPEELAPTDKVQILNNTSFIFEDLNIGTNNNIDHCCWLYSATDHGLELQLANSTKVNNFPDNPRVHLIKTGQGGSRLSQWNVGGTYWNKFLERVGAAKTQLSTDRQWITWISIGINDFIAGTPVSTFKTELIAHINKIKAELPGTIIILTQFQAMSSNSGYPAYNTVMEEIASTEHNVFVVDSTGADLDDGNHWSYDGLKVVADRMINITNTQLGLIYPCTPTSLDATPNGTQVDLSWTAPISDGGSSIINYLVEYKTSGESTWTEFNHNTSTETSVSVTDLQENTDYNFRVSGVNVNGAGNPVMVNSTTPDVSGPTPSQIFSTPTLTTTTITWITNEPSSGIVEYGLTNTYGTTTIETNTSPRVLSHSMVLSGLVTCTTYNYRVHSKDTTQNQGTSVNKTFTTTGCTGGSGIIDESVKSITGATGGTTDLNEISLDIPSGAIGSDAVYQIKALNKNTVLGSVGSPSNLKTVGNNVFDLKALTNTDTKVATFSKPIEVKLSYKDSDVIGVDESSLVIYRYDGVEWHSLAPCTVDTNLNTVTCFTSDFSVFGLFGAPVSVLSLSSGSGIHYGCKDLKALNYEYFAAHNQALCKYETTSTTTLSPLNLTRNLKHGSKGEDVKQLQVYLNKHSYTLAKEGAGSPNNETTYFGSLTKKAVIKFQLDLKLIGDGIVGPMTRGKMK